METLYIPHMTTYKKVGSLFVNYFPYVKLYRNTWRWS